MNDPHSIDLFSSPVFWIVVAIILFAAGTFFPFIYARNNTEEDDFRYTYNLIHDTLYIVKNVIFSIAIIMNRKTGKIPRHSVSKKR